MKTKTKVTLLIAVTAVFATIAGASWFSGVGHKADEPMPTAARIKEAETRLVRPIPTAVVLPLPELLTREFPGKVRANKRVQLAFSVAGQLIELNALEGRLVRRGEIVARLDPRDNRNARDAAKAKYDDAKRKFDRFETLYERKVVPQAEYDSTKAALEMAAAELRIRQKALDDTVLWAPFDGVIATRLVENHEHVKSQQSILSIQDISRVEVVVQVPERLIARGGARSLHNIAVHLDVDGGREFEAVVRELSTEADPITRTYRLVLEMEPPRDITVFPGMTAMVRAEVDRSRPVEGWTPNHTLVPYAAVVNGGDGKSYVWGDRRKGRGPSSSPGRTSVSRARTA